MITDSNTAGNCALLFILGFYIYKLRNVKFTVISWLTTLTLLALSISIIMIFWFTLSLLLPMLLPLLSVKLITYISLSADSFRDDYMLSMDPLGNKPGTGPSNLGGSGGGGGGGMPPPQPPLIEDIILKGVKKELDKLKSESNESYVKDMYVESTEPMPGDGYDILIEKERLAKQDSLLKWMKLVQDSLSKLNEEQKEIENYFAPSISKAKK